MNVRFGLSHSRTAKAPCSSQYIPVTMNPHLSIFHFFRLISTILLVNVPLVRTAKFSGAYWMPPVHVMFAATLGAASITVLTEGKVKTRANGRHCVSRHASVNAGLAVVHWESATSFPTELTHLAVRVCVPPLHCTVHSPHAEVSQENVRHGSVLHS